MVPILLLLLLFATNQADTPPIGVIQGDGRASPFVNQRVTFEGVVTGIHEDQNAAGDIFYTLFIQDLPGREDGRPETSDAMPVFSGRRRPSVAIGDHVRVSGRVTEFFGLTEIDDNDLRIEFISSNAVLPSPIEINPAADSGFNYYERYEGMRVMLGFLPATVVNPTFAGCGFAVVHSDAGAARIFRRQSTDLAGTVIPVLYRSDVNCEALPQLKSGDQISGLTGPLTYHFDQYKIVVQDFAETLLDSAPLPPLPDPPQPGAGQFSLISYNVENFFDEVDDTGSDAEPKLSPAQQSAKRQKLAYQIAAVAHCPTVILIQEVEKERLLQNLAVDLEAACGFRYEVVHRESRDGRGIDLALMLDPRRVDVRSAELRQACTLLQTDVNDRSADCGRGESPLFSRPPLVVRLTIDGLPVTVINNHFKSKREGEQETQPRRERQATFVAAIVAELDAEAVIVGGDFNDFEQSPTAQRLAAAGLFNVLQTVAAEQRYSYVFSGVSQTIDGIFATPALAADVAHTALLHINADFPDGYATDTSPERLPYRATDHDIPYVVWNLPSAASAPPAEGVSSTLIVAGVLLLLLLATLIGYRLGRR